MTSGTLCASLIFFAALSVAFPPAAMGQLNPYFYDQVCPQALPAIRAVVEQAVARNPRVGASLLRMHFHDCFVNGCDASLLLDDTPTFTGEKTAGPNMNSLRGFDVIDRIKAAVDHVCHGHIVSCADIIAVAARDSVVALGGRYYEVQLGRRDARMASKEASNNNIPPPSFDLPALLSNFRSHGLSLKDLVVLSGAHTVGIARCTVFRDRIYNETSTIDARFDTVLRSQCPRSGGDDNPTPLDRSPFWFDTGYYDGLLRKEGVLHSDQQLFKGDHDGATDRLVAHYSANPDSFWEDFGVSMLKMGNMKPLTGNMGEIRTNCRRVN